MVAPVLDEHHNLALQAEGLAVRQERRCIFQEYFEGLESPYLRYESTMKRISQHTGGRIELRHCHKCKKGEMWIGNIGTPMSSTLVCCNLHLHWQTPFHSRKGFCNSVERRFSDFQPSIVLGSGSSARTASCVEIQRFTCSQVLSCQNILFNYRCPRNHAKCMCRHVPRCTWIVILNH